MPEEELSMEGPGPTLPRDLPNSEGKDRLTSLQRVYGVKGSLMDEYDDVPPERSRAVKGALMRLLICKHHKGSSDPPSWMQPALP